MVDSTYTAHFPTASSTAVFINGIHIDQVHRVDFKETDPRIPLYGYNDHMYSRTLKGRRVLQGFLVINYTYPGYLAAALRSSNSKQNLKYNTRIVENIENIPANTTEASRKARAEYITSLMLPPGTVVTKVGPNLGFPVGRQYVGFDTNFKKCGIHRSRTKSDEMLASEDLKAALLAKATGNDINLAKAGEQNFTDNVLNLIDPVDIVIYYSNPHNAKWTVELTDVEFTDLSQTTSAAGADGSSEPLYETYEFIAKTRKIIRFEG